MDALRNQLKQINHYTIHPEMVPFIGENYLNHKILIIF